MPGEYSQMALEAHFKKINERLGMIEEQLERVSAATNVPYVKPLDEIPEDVVQLAQSGKTLEAAKRYRELTDVDVKQAMEVVSQL
jgi:ribosomal protein L7/L12